MSSNATLDRFHTDCTVPGTWNAGVDGDTRHTGEGYHTWRKLLRSGDYSSGRGQNASTRDFGGRDNCSAAIDRGGSVPAVQIMTGRLLAAIGTEHGRWLLRGVREFNGFDGRNVLNRDAVLGWTQNYTPDDSHKTHIHVGFFRDTCENQTVISDALSVVNGTADLNGKAAPPIEEDDGMANITPQEFAALLKTGIVHAALTDAVNDAVTEPHFVRDLAKALAPTIAVEVAKQIKA